MVLNSSYFFIIFTVVVVSIITAQEQSEDQIQSPSGFDIPPFFDSNIRNRKQDRSPNSRPLSGIPPNDRLPNTRPPKGRRPIGNAEQDIQEIFRTVVSCNYTVNPGRSCSSCDQTLYCSILNIGVTHKCRGIMPYCNEGYCSTTPGSACNSTSSE